MKHKVLLTTLSLGIALLALSSYQNGPAHGGAGNRSGSAGANGCSTGGCHRAENANLALTVTLTDDATSVVVTDGKYVPGHSYTVALVGLYSGSDTYTHLGFQASIVNSASANSGTITATAANTATIVENAINLIEHTAPLPKTGSEFKSSFKWVAPAAGAGDAKFFARMVANNHNGISGDDTPNAIQATFSEKSSGTAIKDVTKNDIFRIYPNPAQDRLNVKLNQLTAGKYNIHIASLDGKSVISSTSNFASGEMTIDISNLAKGIYTLNVENGTDSQVVRFVKK